MNQHANAHKHKPTQTQAQTQTSTGVSRSEVGAQIRQSISLALQRFNAMMFLARDITT